MSRLAAGAVAGAVVVAAVSVYALTGSAEPPPLETAAAQEVPTSEATLACPESPQTKHTDASLLAVTPEVGDAGSGGSGPPSGSLTVGQLGAQSTPIETETQVGLPIVRPLTTSLDPSVVVAGLGAMSAGAAAFQWSVEDGKNRSGRAVAHCGAGAEDWWFNGADTSVGSTSRLVLTNTTPAIAVVDVELLGPAGPVQTVGQRGIALAPNSRQSIDLARFAQNLSPLAVHVHATAGLVSAAVETSQVDGVTPVGTEWLPPTVAPSTAPIIDAALDGSASQDLLIVNPNEDGALVQVEVVGDSGPFVPTGLERVRVGPESVKTVKLGKVSHNGAVAVRLSSDTPVTGAVVSTAKGGADYAVSAPSPSLVDSAVVPVLPDVDLSIAFTGSSEQSIGRFRLTGVSRDGQQVFADTVTIDGLRTTAWTPPKKTSGDAVYVVVSLTLDTSAQAIAQYSDKDGVSAIPVLPGVFTVTRPAVTSER